MPEQQPRPDADALLAKMRADQQSDWPSRLLRDLANAPMIESEMALHVPRPTSSILSRQELDVLAYMSRGLNRPQTADAMNYSLGMVQDLLKGARYRLRAKNTMHACCEAIRQGLIR